MQLTASLLLLALLLFSWRMVRIRWQMVGGLLHEMSLLMLLALFFLLFPQASAPSVGCSMTA